MARLEYWIRIRDKNLSFIGEIGYGQFYEFEWELPWMEVGKWSMSCPFSSKAAQLLLQIASDPNNGGVGGIYVVRNGEYLFSGPLEEVHEEWDEEQGHVLKFNGTDELGFVDRRLASPHPKRFVSPYMDATKYVSPDPTFTTRYHVDRFPNLDDTTKYPAGAAAMEYIHDNIGESATYDSSGGQPRRVPQLATKNINSHSPSSFHGAIVNYETPFRSRGERMLEMVQTICNFSEWEKKPIQIRGRQLDNVVNPSGDLYGGRRIYFEDFISPERPDVIFSPDLGNMTSYKYKRIPPKANMVQVGGSGENQDRVFAHAGDEPSRKMYGDRELFEEYTGRNEATDETTAREEVKELTTHVYATLAENAERTEIEIQPRDTEAVQFMRDWKPFDTVTVRIRGEETKNIIRVTSGRVDDSGEEISISIGNQGVVSKGLRLFDRVDNLEYRYDGLTKRSSGA